MQVLSNQRNRLPFMKRAIILLSFPILFFMAIGSAQTVYQVGTSTVSIEPDNSVISLSLGGYAAVPGIGALTTTAGVPRSVALIS